ncbi:Gfo/Idh/MocA family oxidoreductase [Streptomyces phaeochromogenes]|uniref:Gfo/Idh/MocA family oxidoreductase n=1 Tax=Streptomyces phaeochromogenes TaxID=1923 RepID=A0ABZ1HM87_STRPH|nr:Gfo/Idh/MocA family oxidoreductase [Streptomyces phaeochromogenes]WSD19726.1 Gfo/Idh/MocA family oxidoreductase [Streptomyces phaeochromogenes]
MKQLGVALIGHSFMGAVHSQAWRTVGHVYDLPARPMRTVLVGRRAQGAAHAAERLGWQDSTDDWKSVLRRQDVDIIDICTPGDSHAEIAVAALEAGKHVLCEKPLATTVAEAESMADAARRARAHGPHAMAGFTYRRVPALALARQLIAEGRLGEIRHVRAAYLQDWLSDPSAPFSWRLQRERAGAGALGDIGSHIIDLSQYLLDDTIDGVSAQTATFVGRRPLSDKPERTGQVTVDDAAAFTARFTGGALATYEATRYATGRKNALRIEVNGTCGSMSFDFESMNELAFYDTAQDTGGTAGFRRIQATEPGHPYLEGWWPPGHGLGYEHAFTHQARDLVTAIADGTDPAPGFEEGLRVQRVIAAVEASAADSSRYTPVDRPGSV